MSKYNLTEQQSETIVEFVKFAKEKEQGWFYVIVGKKVNLHTNEDLESSSNRAKRGLELPKNRVFYHALSDLGYFYCSDHKIEDFIVVMNQIAFDYDRYLKKSRLMQWWENREHELVHETTVTAKIFFLLTGILIGAIITALLAPPY